MITGLLFAQFQEADGYGILANNLKSISIYGTRSEQVS
jgi:hypothetical protein